MDQQLATAVVAATAVIVVVTAAAAEQENKDDDPSTISTKTVVTHKQDLLFVFHHILCQQVSVCYIYILKKYIDFS